MDSCQPRAWTHIPCLPDLLPVSQGGTIGLVGDQASAEMTVMQGRRATALGGTPEKGAHGVLYAHELWWEKPEDPLFLYLQHLGVCVGGWGGGHGHTLS